MKKLAKTGIILGIVFALAGFVLKLMHYAGSMEALLFGLVLLIISAVINLFTGKSQGKSV